MAKRDDDTPEVSVVTPKVTFVYPNFRTPDYGYENKDADDPKFTTKFKLSEEAFAGTACRKPKGGDEKSQRPLKEILDELLEYATGPMRKEYREKLRGAQQKKNFDQNATVYSPYQEVLDNDTEEPTGEIILSAKTKVYGKRKDGTPFKKKLPIFDAKNKPLPFKKDPSTGSEGRLQLTFRPFVTNTAIGVAAFLNGVQVTAFRERGDGQTAEGFGFEEDEDGYSVDDEEADDEGEADADESDDDDEDDDGGDY